MSTNYYLVDDESQDYWKGVFLCQFSGGWVPQIKWHDYNYCHENCSCPDGTHVYRNIDEFIDFVQSDGVVKDEYNRVHDKQEFLDKMWEKNNPEEYNRKPDGRQVWNIEGWHFVRGAWS